MKIAVVGGDERALRMYRRLREEGYACLSPGLTRDGRGLDGLNNADVALLPYPFAAKNGVIRGVTASFPVSDVLAALPPRALIIAGEGVSSQEHNIRRYAEYEAFLNENADISAEGTLYCVMRDMERALFGMRVCVTGYGKLARALTKRLIGVAASPVVFARSTAQRELAASDGAFTFDITALPFRIADADILVNTVPAPVIGQDAASALRPDAKVYETASLPGGFHFRARALLGERITNLGAIPAWYAPQSAGEALLRAALFLCREEGIL